VDSRSSRLEVESNAAATLATAHCPEEQCARPRQAEVRRLSEAETVIGAHGDKPVEEVVQRLRYSLPPGLERQFGFVPPARMIRQLSDAAQFIGAPEGAAPEEVGRTRILPLPPADQKRP
jgi:hypothetical protein